MPGCWPLSTVAKPKDNPGQLLAGALVLIPRERLIHDLKTMHDHPNRRAFRTIQRGAIGFEAGHQQPSFFFLAVSVNEVKMHVALPMNEHELLHAYVEAGSEAAFTELTARYTDLVYSSAMRQVQSPQLAEEVTQSVFLALACKASRLRREVVLSGWLLRATRYLAMDIQKAEWRRQKREQIAAAMVEPVRLPEEAPVWQSALPILDEALDRLRQCDRQALALRFFEKKGFDEVGRILGISEDAAKKRVGRAVERLRRGLLRRKVILSALALTGGLAAESVKAAPVWLAARAARTALSSVAAAEAAGLGSWLAGTWHKSLSQGVAWCVVALLIPCAWQSARLASARAEESRLEAMLATLAGQQADLAREQVQVQRRLRRASNNLARLEKPLTLASGLMASSGFTNLDPRLFHWDEAADYVRLPKAVMRWVSFDAKDSRPGVGSGPDPRAGPRNGRGFLRSHGRAGVEPGRTRYSQQLLSLEFDGLARL